MDQTGNRILIIGGVALGPKAASRARRLDPDAEITIVEKGDLFSYAGCGMPYYIEGQIKELDELLKTSLGVPRDEDYFLKTKNVKLLGHTEAQKIDRYNKKVTVKDLRTNLSYDIEYDKLVLGVGASPIVPRIEGMELKGVYRLYSPEDAKAIRDELDRGVEDIAIVGGGLIGMEVCSAFVSRVCNVTVFEMMDRLVPALLDPDMSLILEKQVRKMGVKLCLGRRVTKIIGEGSGKVTGVETADGEVHKAAMVIVAIGVRPNVELAKDAGLSIGDTGAIKVNEYLQTNDPNIYAGGDCVENVDLVTGKKVYMPLGSTANKHGRVIGDNVTGRNTKFKGIVRTAVFKIMGFNVGKTGLGEGEAKELGYDTLIAVAPRTDSSEYYPGNLPITIKIIADRSGKLLGCQALGMGDVVKRIDIVATCLSIGAVVDDVSDLDLGYAPPYSTAIDAVAHAANIIRNKVHGLAHGISSIELRTKMESRDDFILLDVRSKSEVAELPFPYSRIRNIPLGELRGKLDELNYDKETIIVCKTSVRAYEAERILAGRGFVNVRFLDGGYAAWPF